MPIIRPSGLLSGERIAALSDIAKLYWPFLYAASNGYGRFELDYFKIIDSGFRYFQQKPTQETIRELIREYRDKHLLFIYKANGRLWCAWDDAAHQQYFNSRDKASPTPPEPAFSEWRDQYKAKKQSREEELTELEKEFDPAPENCSIGFNIESISNQYEVDNESITNLHNTNTDTQLNTQTHSTQEHIDSEHNTTRAREKPVLLVKVMGWEETVEAALKAGMAIDPSTDSPFFKNIWAPSPMEDKAECVRGIYAGIADGLFGPDSPLNAPAFRTYWAERRWNEIRPRIRGQPRAKNQGVMEQFDRFLKRDLEDAEQPEIYK